MRTNIDDVLDNLRDHNSMCTLRPLSTATKYSAAIRTIECNRVNYEFQKPIQSTDSCNGELIRKSGETKLMNTFRNLIWLVQNKAVDQTIISTVAQHAKYDLLLTKMLIYSQYIHDTVGQRL